MNAVSAPAPNSAASRPHKAALGSFLRRNPFDSPYTLGFYYREKMRAIHRIAPEESFGEILEVGAGRGGLTALLYPNAQITNLDFNASFAADAPNRQPNVRFVCADATALPLRDQSFDAVTMFDLLEHVPDDRAAAQEALRVLRPGGVLLVSSPNLNWRFPYYGALAPLCPHEEEMFAEWGHVRRGYEVPDLESIIGLPCERWATFINPLTVISHDLAFSRLPRRARQAACLALSPLTWAAYALHKPHTRGTEIASAWRKPAA